MNRHLLDLPLVLGVLCLALIGCSNQEDVLTQTSLVTSVEIPITTQTPVLAGLDPEPIITPSPLPTGETVNRQGEPPLNLTFPTPGVEPISRWRNPLYPVPFALSQFDHFYFVRPIAVDQVNWPLADYRYGYIFPGTESVHTGVDIDAALHTPIIAAGDGKVTFAGFGLQNGNSDPNDPYGMAVVIRHDFGLGNRQLSTVYAHMDRVDVVVGQRVNAGDQLGIVGETGFTTGPHVHFEVRLETNGSFTTRNPELWLSPPQGMGVLAGKLLNTNGSLLTSQDITVVSRATEISRIVTSYAYRTVTSDEYYRENVVLGSLDPGEYWIFVDYLGERYRTLINIYPGTISYFTFKGEKGFTVGPPNLPYPDSLTGGSPPVN
jgi:murein DD-endopeptidase MepM/ murein hydrolase activator NlpD